MKPSVEQIGNLLALKRHEGPESGYWQNFLCEFHQARREPAVRKCGLMSLCGRVSGGLSELGPSKWAYGAGLAYATVTVAFFLKPRGIDVEKTPATPVNYQVVPATAPPAVEQLDQLDLSPSTQGSVGEHVF